MSLLRVSEVADNWVDYRNRTITSLRCSAIELRASHQQNAEAEHESASASLAGGIAGLGGILLAPVSGGLSLALCGYSSFAASVSYLNKRLANKEDESIKQKVDRDVKQAILDDRSATVQLNEILQHFSYLEYKRETMMIGDKLISLGETSVTSLSIRAREIDSSRLSFQLRMNDLSISIPGLDISTQVVNFNAAMTSAEKVVKFTKVTKEVCRETRTMKEVVKSVNEISQTAKSLSAAKQASNTVKTVTQVATDTDKAIHMTRITTNAASVTKVSETAIKAAAISKVGLAMNAIVIPLDIYNLIVASDNLSKSHEDVERIETEANNLEQDMKNIKIQVESFTELHLQLYKVYENHRTKLIYDYLKIMEEKLQFSLGGPVNVL